jgi:hypothetical protein
MMAGWYAYCAEQDRLDREITAQLAKAADGIARFRAKPQGAGPITGSAQGHVESMQEGATDGR